MAELAEDLLPPSLREISQVIGIKATHQLVQYKGGTRLDVPVRYRADHELVQRLGERATRALIETYHGEQITVARAHQATRRLLYAEIFRRYTAGERTAAELALEYGMTERFVYWIVAKLRNIEVSQQQSLSLI